MIASRNNDFENPKKEFERELHNIRINGGGDCPEMSVYAIREALLLALGMISTFPHLHNGARAAKWL